VQAWRHADIPVSKAPVLYWKGAELLTSAPSSLGAALTLYRADRGAEKTEMWPAGRKMTLFYFEWDSLELGAFNDAVGGHATEVCNVEYGSFKLLQSGGHRVYQAANGETLAFDCTQLAERGGTPVYVFRMPWLQGYGTLEGLTQNRATRLRSSFMRHRGAARVLEAGIFGAASEDEAWELFRREVLDRLEWMGGL